MPVAGVNQAADVSCSLSPGAPLGFMAKHHRAEFWNLCLPFGLEAYEDGKIVQLLLVSRLHELRWT